MNELRQLVFLAEHEDWPGVDAQVRMAMAGLDQWAAAADKLLRGRSIALTRPELGLMPHPNAGAVATITGVSIAHGASGYHMFLTARPHGKPKAEDFYKLFELGVDCELLKKDDVP